MVDKYIVHWKDDGKDFKTVPMTDEEAKAFIKDQKDAGSKLIFSLEDYESPVNAIVRRLLIVILTILAIVGFILLLIPHAIWWLGTGKSLLAWYGEQVEKLPINDFS